MVLISYNEASLEKHKITYEQVQEAITDPMRAEFDMSEQQNIDKNFQPYNLDNYRRMIVGLAKSMRSG